MATRIAFIGFRHGHILDLYQLCGQRDDIEIVAACEEDAAARAQLSDTDVAITHAAYAEMLDSVECDIVACGDYYGIRGERVLQALNRGKHVIVDKPLCTSLEELDHITEASAAKGLRVGCMLDLGSLGPYVQLRRMIQRGILGEALAITFLGQHPLLYGTRPAWYFEPGKHGGTINDIGIHAIDIIPWMTGRRIVEITAARAWNARLPQHPQFQDGAMLMLRLDNNGAAMGDVSYFASDKHGYQMPAYWRFTISGVEGVAETCCHADTVKLWRHDTEDVIEERVAPGRTGAYLDDFLADIAGTPAPGGLDTERVLESARIALLAQQAADTGAFPAVISDA